MAVLYVDGSVGNNSWDGTVPVFTSGSTGPKLTLNGAEDKPVAASDTVHVRTVDANGNPIVYRELLTLDISGTAGNPITYIADVSGVIWGVPGFMARITGSDNDTTATRSNCITATSRNYRTFRGFSFDIATGALLNMATACGNWIVEDCFFAPNASTTAQFTMGGTGTANTVRHCVFFGGRSVCLVVTHSAAVDNAGHLVENCLFIGGPLGSQGGIHTNRVGGITVKNCTFWGNQTAVRANTALSVGQTTTVNNNIITNCTTGMSAITAPGTNEEVTENYNSFYGCNADRSNVSTGANSVAYPPLFQPPMLLSGFRFPWNPFDLSQWSALRRLAGTSMSSDGLHGIARPATDSKKSWGAIQFVDVSRETTTKRTGAASLKLAEAGRHQMFVPVTNVSTVFSCYVQWQTDYAGTKPQMLIKQPGQSDTTVTATGSSGAWELLTTTLTPAASPGYVVVEFVSSNTGTGSVAVFVDDFVVT